eukprot:13801151-Alexandrium_andersonii.AAC.1
MRAVNLGSGVGIAFAARTAHQERSKQTRRATFTWLNLRCSSRASRALRWRPVARATSILFFKNAPPTSHVLFVMRESSSWSLRGRSRPPTPPAGTTHWLKLRKGQRR